MRKGIVIFAAAWLMGVTLTQAQQLPLYSQYMHNDFVLNPAIAGTNPYYEAKFSFRKQWMGFEGAPSTQTLSFHMPLSEQKMGAGGYLYNDMLGPVRRTGLNGVYAYHLQVGSDKTLSMGLEAGVFQYAIKGSELTTQDPDDQAIVESTATLFAPDAAFGVYFYSQKYFASVAVPQLIPVKIDFTGNDRAEIGQLVPHFFLFGGYHFTINDNFSIEPSLLMKTVRAAPYQVDINTKAYYQEKYWLGLSYRNSFLQNYQTQALVFLVGAEISKKFHVGYSYDLSIGEIGAYNKGSHEITLGYYFNHIQQQSASPRL